MATNLFAPLPSQGSGGGAVKPLVEFKAGKMTYNSGTHKVTPDKRKGLVQLTQAGDGLIHFIWKDRTSGVAEDDLIIFPEDAVFKKVKQVPKEQGRVYLLEFKASNRRLFFWIQEGKDDKDDENANKINQYINNPPTGSPSESNSMGALGAFGMGMGMGLPGGMEPNALMQMFGNQTQRSSTSASTPLSRQPPATSTSTQAPSTSSTPSSTSSTAPSSSSNPNLAVGDLQSILSNIGVPRGSASNVGQSSTRLSQIINPDQVIPIIMGSPAVVERLLPLLPEERRTTEELQQILRSPQFQQAVDFFGSAVQSGQADDLLRQFGIQPGNQHGLTMESFLQRLQQQLQGKPGDKKDDDKDKMDTK